jgi:hypothetical protein
MVSADYGTRRKLGHGGGWLAVRQDVVNGPWTMGPSIQLQSTLSYPTAAWRHLIFRADARAPKRGRTAAMNEERMLRAKIRQTLASAPCSAIRFRLDNITIQRGMYSTLSCDLDVDRVHLELKDAHSLP